MTDRACVEQGFGNLTYREGAKVALARFDQMIAASGPVEANCHRIAHTIGSASLARLKENVGQAFAVGQIAEPLLDARAIRQRALLEHAPVEFEATGNRVRVVVGCF